MAAGIGPSVDLCPVADGGEGTAEVLVRALGGEIAVEPATDPLGRRVSAQIGLLDDGATAIVEVAQASGLWRLGRAERDAWRASSRGTGELIARAIERGARTVLVAAGGSASTDGGAGALAAFDPSGARLVVLCDTRVGYEQIAAIFGPQKGADAGTVTRLQDRLDDLAERLPRDPRGVEMGGAAGGLAGGPWAHGAELVGGAAYVLDALGFDDRLGQARLVVTGEGRLDRSTLSGKALAEVATRARQAGVPCHAIVGENALDRFGARVLGLESIQEAGDAAEIMAAAARLEG